MSHRIEKPKKKIVLGLAIVALLFGFGLIYEYVPNFFKDDGRKTMVTSDPCPRDPLRKVSLTTPGGNAWSDRVRIPPGCGVRWGFTNEEERRTTIVKTFPDEREHPGGVLELGYRRPVGALSFASKK